MNSINDGNNINFARSASPKLASLITKMTKADALAPIVALEATVTGGRTVQAYKRGGKEESRERIIEETTGAVVWLWGVKVLNEIGDKLLGKYFKTPDTTFDVGTDKVLRTPFENYMKKGIKKNVTPGKVSALKCAKVLTSIVIANLIVGFVVPKINHYITQTIRHDQKEKERALNAQKQEQLIPETENTGTNPSSTAFKGGGFAAMNAFTNAIENTNAGKLLSTDIGVAGGRMINARTKEERNEIAVRDLGSIYFYMWASGHVGNLLNLIESGRATRLNPETANTVTDFMNKLVESNNGEMSVEEFTRAALGKSDSDIKLPEGIKFEEGNLSWFAKTFNKNAEPLKVAKVSDLEKIFTDKDIMDRIRAMSKLQPLRQGEAVITKQQIIDAINIAEINNPEMLSKTFSEFTNGDSIKDYKYISNKNLYKLKDQMADFIKDIIKQAKNGKITKEVIENTQRKNIIYSGINFAAGFAVAAAFLSTIIPKIQYLMTQKRTGINVFPGTYDYEHNREMDA